MHICVHLHLSASETVAKVSHLNQLFLFLFIRGSLLVKRIQQNLSPIKDVAGGFPTNIPNCYYEKNIGQQAKNLSPSTTVLQRIGPTVLMAKVFSRQHLFFQPKRRVKKVNDFSC